MTGPMEKHPRASVAGLLLALCLLAAACVVDGAGSVEQHRWWAGLGPVLPHDSFPADCSLCHLGEDWYTLRDDFAFDHEAETGVPLAGAHARAGCLRCHNDRGPTEVFQAQGCGGCHEDVHYGDLGVNCESCHQQVTWRPVGQIELHNRTRFPLFGAHAATACYRCHPGAEVGQFVPTDTECLTCHADDLAVALAPNHLVLGFVNNCDRCHIPTSWSQAQINLPGD